MLKRDVIAYLAVYGYIVVMYIVLAGILQEPKNGMLHTVRGFLWPITAIGELYVWLFSERGIWAKGKRRKRKKKMLPNNRPWLACESCQTGMGLSESTRHTCDKPLRAPIEVGLYD